MYDYRHILFPVDFSGQTTQRAASSVKFAAIRKYVP